MIVLILDIKILLDVLHVIKKILLKINVHFTIKKGLNYMISRNKKKSIKRGVRLYKLIIFTITFGSYVFADSWDNTPKSVETSDQNNNQYCFAEDTSSDDFKVERRRGKGKRGRRRGGSGLR